MITYTTFEDDVLDLLCYERGADFDAVLKNNPHLSSYGTHLPEGIEIIFDEPVLIGQEAVKTEATISLWD